jgi:hypothetical protein
VATPEPRPGPTRQMETRQADRGPGLVPGAVDVRAAQLAALRPDEDEAARPWFGEPFQVPADLRGDLGRERHDATASSRLGRIWPGAALVELGERFGDPDLARVQVDVLAPKPNQLAQRMSAKVASRISVRYRTGTVSASLKTTGSGTMARSSDSSLPAPAIRHGLRPTMRSSSAVSKMACSRR